MSERPDTLDRLVDALDVGTPPVPEIVARGSARRRRRRRSDAIAVTVMTAVLVAGGATLASRTQEEPPTPTTAPVTLPARFAPAMTLPALVGVPAGQAAWSREQATLWVPATLSSCGLRASSQRTGTAIRIDVAPFPAEDMVCDSAGVLTAVVVGGVSELPTQLIVSYLGDERMRDVVEVGPVDELAAHPGAACPDRLPLGDDPDGHGFGVTAPATSAPRHAEPDRAWVCQYVARGAGRTASGGRTYVWTRRSPAVPVPTTALRGLDRLAPFDGAGRICTSELGPRWMLVLAHGTDLTGVVIDDFGCEDVRLTDEPFLTPPGEAWQPGTVPGVLQAPDGLLAAIRTAAAEGPSNR